MIKSRNNIYVGANLDSYGCGSFTVLEVDKENVIIRFNTGCIVSAHIDCVVSGYVKDPLFPKVFGVGYIGIGNYKSRDKFNDMKSKITQEYRAWSNMLERCYNKNPTNNMNRQAWYENVFVDEEWHNFQNFAEWYVAKRKVFSSYNMDRVDLDKDILAIPGKPKKYSPKTCCLIPTEINRALIRIDKEEAGLLKRKLSYSVVIDNKIIAKNILSKEEATKIYKKEKQNRIAILADKYKYVLEKEVYYKLCNWFDNEE